MHAKRINRHVPLFLMSFLLFFTFEFILAYLQIFKNYSSDIGPHLASIAKIGTLNFPQMGFEYTVYFLSWINGISFAWVSVFLLAFCVGLQACLSYFLIYKLSIHSKSTYFIFTLIALTVTAIYFPYATYSLTNIEKKAAEFVVLHFQGIMLSPVLVNIIQFFGHFGLYGLGSPNVWHSPTLTVVKPFAFVITYLYISNHSIKMAVVVSILLLISCFYKPSFATIFLPAVVVYELFKNRLVGANSFLRIIILVLPATLLLAIMFCMLTYIFKLPDGQHTQVIFAPFKVIHLYSKNAFISFLQATAFPILILIVRFKNILTDNPYLLFSWIMLIFGYLFLALLAQSGSLFAAGNFGWGYEIGLSLIFTFSIVEYLRFIKEDKDKPHFIYLNRAIILFLGLHILSGLLYLSKLAVNIIA